MAAPDSLVNIGLYGGTFDPIHNGHLILAREAMEYLKLDRLIFIPNAISPHKTKIPPAPAQLRSQMVAAAIEGEPGFGIDLSELERSSPSYTIDTVLELKSRHRDAHFFYLIGEDNLHALRTWRQIDELELLVQFVVLSRSEEKIPHPYVTLSRRIDISATEIRERVANGRSIRYLVPEKVREIIERNQFYKEPPSPPRS
jgi:nicotinate-nucleotide adenylyltransferase